MGDDDGGQMPTVHRQIAILQPGLDLCQPATVRGLLLLCTHPENHHALVVELGVLSTLANIFDHGDREARMLAMQCVQALFTNTTEQLRVAVAGHSRLFAAAVSEAHAHNDGAGLALCVMGLFLTEQEYEIDVDALESTALALLRSGTPASRSPVLHALLVLSQLIPSIATSTTIIACLADLLMHTTDTNEHVSLLELILMMTSTNTNTLPMLSEHPGFLEKVLTTALANTNLASKELKYGLNLFSLCMEYQGVEPIALPIWFESKVGALLQQTAPTHHGNQSLVYENPTDGARQIHTLLMEILEGIAQSESARPLALAPLVAGLQAQLKCDACEQVRAAMSALGAILQSGEEVSFDVARPMLEEVYIVMLREPGEIRTLALYVLVNCTVDEVVGKWLGDQPEIISRLKGWVQEMMPALSEGLDMAVALLRNVLVCTSKGEDPDLLPLFTAFSKSMFDARRVHNEQREQRASGANSAGSGSDAEGDEGPGGQARLIDSLLESALGILSNLSNQDVTCEKTLAQDTHLVELLIAALRLPTPQLRQAPLLLLRNMSSLHWEHNVSQVYLDSLLPCVRAELCDAKPKLDIDTETSEALDECGSNALHLLLSMSDSKPGATAVLGDRELTTLVLHTTREGTVEDRTSAICICFNLAKYFDCTQLIAAGADMSAFPAITANHAVSVSERIQAALAYANFAQGNAELVTRIPAIADEQLLRYVKGMLYNARFSGVPEHDMCQDTNWQADEVLLGIRLLCVLPANARKLGLSAEFWGLLLDLVQSPVVAGTDAVESALKAMLNIGTYGNIRLGIVADLPKATSSALRKWVVSVRDGASEQTLSFSEMVEGVLWAGQKRGHDEIQ